MPFVIQSLSALSAGRVIEYESEPFINRTTLNFVNETGEPTDVVTVVEGEEYLFLFELVFSSLKRVFRPQSTLVSSCSGCARNCMYLSSPHFNSFNASLLDRPSPPFMLLQMAVGRVQGSRFPFTGTLGLPRAKKVETRPSVFFSRGGSGLETASSRLPAGSPGPL